MATLDDVALSYGGRRVLDGVTLRLAEASVSVLFGVNGAGKTTLIRTLCGRMAVERGRVRVLGRDPYRDVAGRRAIGFVPQTIALYPTLTVRENLTAFGKAAGSGKRRAERLEVVLAAVHVTDVAERRVGELSGGFQRRVNLGAALMGEPALLLLDEPTVGLDAEAKQVLVEIIRTTARGGAAILLTTHDFDVAAAVADRAGILAGGVIVADGPPAELLATHFGERMQVTLTTRNAADPDVTPALSRLGLRAFGDGAWRSPAAGLEAEAVAAILAEAAAGRHGVTSLTVDKPGLPQLCAALLDRVRADD